LGIADFLDFPHRAFFLESIDERLHRCISDALVIRQAFENFADGTDAQLPKLLEDSCFCFREARHTHCCPIVCRQLYYKPRFSVQRFLTSPHGESNAVASLRSVCSRLSWKKRLSPGSQADAT